MSEQKLKPCPFCGGEAMVVKMGYPHFVYCTSCGAKVHKWDIERSVDAWNRRSIDADIVEAVKRAIRELCEGGYGVLLK